MPFSINNTDDIMRVTYDTLKLKKYIRMKSPKYIPEIRPVVLWDVAGTNIDYTKSSDFIICRVFNYGNFQEIADIIICYGKDYVKNLLLSTLNLDAFGLAVASAVFEIPQNEFKCYELKQYPRSY